LDGDTFDMVAGNDTVRVRLCGIDAPEGRRGKGKAATDALSQ
jgi:endonuclease YncB( thermonuclease family)